MLDQLGITGLRPGPSGNEHAPDHANIDEALANPFAEMARSADIEERPPRDPPRCLVACPPSRAGRGFRAGNLRAGSR